MKDVKIQFSFIRKYNSLAEVLTDHKLASLGDTCINFLYSLALSNKRGKPFGVKVKGNALAEALRNAKLREYLPARMSRHMLADAAEALIVYGWLRNCVSLEEILATLAKTDNTVESLSQLLAAISKRVKFS